MFKLHHVSLSVANLDKSLSFYSLLGFQKILQWDAKDNTLNIAHLKLDQFILELFCFANKKPLPASSQNLDTDLPTLGIKHFALQVTSITEAKAKLQQLGFIDDIEIKHGRTGIDYFFIKDPDGIFIEIVEDNRIFTMD